MVLLQSPLLGVVRQRSIRFEPCAGRREASENGQARSGICDNLDEPVA